MTWTEAGTDSTIPRRFAEMVRRDPQKAAILGATSVVTYESLDDLSNRFAQRLIELEAPPGGRVAVLVGHDETAVAAILAAMKCGLAAVTLNPSDPPGRLAQLRAAIEPVAVITDLSHAGACRAAGFDAPGMVVGPAPRGGTEALPPGPGPDDLAILICTSGSTGRPKIVMQTHRNQLHNALRYTNGLSLERGDRLAWLASLSGGQGLVTVWSALLNGATLCPFSIVDRGVSGLAGWLEEQHVTVFDTIPSVLRSFARTLHDRRIAGVRVVRLASEAAQRSDFDAYRRHFTGDCVLASVLASSEAGVIAQALMHADDEPGEGRLSVGVAVEGVRVVLVDEAGRETEAGTGEIAVEGRYLSPGYWRDEALTTKRFEIVDGRRRFRSGDVAQRAADGSLTIVGRADSQVKVRGYRLQLEEVEAAILAHHPAVAEAVVIVRTTDRGDARLTAFLTAARGRSVDVAALRRTLREVLPSHAVPTAFVVLQAMPLTPHGKVDRERLRDAGRSAAPAVANAGIGTETEQVVAEMWADALELDSVGLEDGFLGLGGDSLTGAMVAAGIEDVFGVDVELQAFAADVTVARLAALIDQQTHRERDAGVPFVRQRVRSARLSFTQARFWMEEQQSDMESRWNVAVPFRIRGPLDVDVFRRTVEQLVSRHEILRTTFAVLDGEPVASVQTEARFELREDDLRTEPDPAATIDRIVAGELSRPYDLGKGPLLRLRLLRVGDDEHLLLRMSHHLIHDAVSWKVFFDELALIYTSLAEGRAPSLTEEPELQYIDYAVWERASLQPNSDRFRAEVEWWASVLNGAPQPIELPFALHSRPPQAAPGDVIRWGLPPADSQALDRLGRTAGATFFVTRLAIFAALLALEAGAGDVVVGTPISTRTRAEVLRMFGPFIDFRQVRLRFDGDPSFNGWLAVVRRAILDVSAHATIPWEVLVHLLRGRGIGIPRASATFVEWSSVLPMSFAGIQVDPLPRPCSTVRGFRLGVNRFDEPNRCWAEFDPEAHDRGRLSNFLERYRALASMFGLEPDRPIRELYLSLAPLDGLAAGSVQ